MVSSTFLQTRQLGHTTISLSNLRITKGRIVETPFFLYNIQRYQMHTWKNYNDASGIKPTVNNNRSNVISFYSSFDYDPHLWLTTGFIGKSNMTGASSKTGIVYRSWAPEFTPCCSICIFMCHCLYLFFFFWRFYVFFLLRFRLDYYIFKLLVNRQLDKKSTGTVLHK